MITIFLYNITMVGIRKRIVRIICRVSIMTSYKSRRSDMPKNDPMG